MERGRVVRAAVHVDAYYKGATEKDLVLFDDGMCNGPELQVGQQYIWYTHRLPSGEIPSRGCSRSRRVKYADEDLKFLKGLEKSAPTATVFGKVLIRPDDFYGGDRGVGGARVTLQGAGRSLEATTDSEGNYSFENLAPYDYTVTAELNGHRMLPAYRDQKVDAKVQARGCAVANVILRPRWKGTIRGRLIRSDGTPAPSGIHLSLKRMYYTRQGKEVWNWIGAFATSGENGEYSFDEVAPGHYKVVLNALLLPSAKSPYPTMYWPSARVEDEAGVVAISENIERQCDFLLPPEPKTAVVNGVAVFADGKPAENARILIRPLTGFQRSPDDDSKRADAQGRFSFAVYEGLDYRVSALVEGPHPLHSADVTVSGSRSPGRIVLLVSRPGRFDNDPIELLRRDKAK